MKALTRRIALREEDGGEAATAVDRARATGPWSLIVVAGLDTLIDGVLLGIGFVAGVKQGLLLTLAFTMETLSLGFVIAVALQTAGVSRGRIILTTGARSSYSGWAPWRVPWCWAAWASQRCSRSVRLS